jgi:hypothetical protein
VTHLARSVTVICLALGVNILTIEDVCFAFTELATVKDTDFDHGKHLLSWNQKSPPPKRRASEWIAVRMTTGCGWHEYLHPAPLSLRIPYGVTDSKRRKYLIVKTPRVHFQY